MVILLKHCLCLNGCKVVTSIDVSLCLDAKKLKSDDFGWLAFVKCVWGGGGSLPNAAEVFN